MFNKVNKFSLIKVRLRLAGSNLFPRPKPTELYAMLPQEVETVSDLEAKFSVCVFLLGRSY